MVKICRDRHESERHLDSSRLLTVFMFVGDKTLPQATGRPRSNLSEHTIKEVAFQVWTTGVVPALDPQE